VNELSAKLLEGCKLLSESCPETNVPLVLTKDGRMFSVGNSQYYRKDGGKLVIEHTAPAPPAPAHDAYYDQRSAHGAASSHARSSFYGAAPTERLSEASSGNLSQRVAAKLLDGWQLLAESCPETNVPLVQSKDGQILSVGTGKYYTREPTGELKELPGGTGMYHLPQPAQPAQQYRPPSLAAYSPPRLGATAAGTTASVPLPASTVPSSLAASYAPPPALGSKGGSALTATHQLSRSGAGAGGHHSGIVAATLVRATPIAPCAHALRPQPSPCCPL
jgi:uncharacterized Zn finger protein (UPF0148 family)